MTTIEDLGEITDTRTEWFSRKTGYGGSTGFIGAGDAQQARNIVASTREHIASIDEPSRRLNGIERVDLVSRTVTELASGHKLIGPWEAAE